MLERFAAADDNSAIAIVAASGLLLLQPGRPPLWQQLLTVFAEVDARKSRRPSRKDSKQSATNRTRKAKQPKASAKKAASRRS